MNTTTKQRPVETLRDRYLKVSIWRNETDKGPHFNATLARTYKDGEGKLKDTESLGSDDLLPAALLLQRAYTRIGKLYREAYATRDEEEA